MFRRKFNVGGFNSYWFVSLALYIGLLANLAPLKLRSVAGTGIAPAIENKILDASFYVPGFDLFRFLVGNIIAGYPNALHGFSAISRGEVVQVVPDTRFVITQFSPRYMFRFMWLGVYVFFGVNIAMCLFGRNRLKN